MNIDPGLLAQMDREKAVLDRAVTGLVDLYRDIHSDRGDSTTATFALMSIISRIEDWKLKGTLACAVHRLAGTGAAAVSIEDRITEILIDQWVPSEVRYGTDEPVGFDSPRKWAAHVARVLVTELGLTEPL